VYAGGQAGTAASTNLLSIGGEVKDGAVCEVVVNDAGIDCDFRVESDGETHMLFVDAVNNRVSIGDDTDGTTATFEVTNADHANFDTTLVQLNNNEANQIALDINAVNTTANVINITTNDTLTTGKIIAIDHNDAATDAGASTTGISYDFDKDGDVESGVDCGYTGISLNLKDAATGNDTAASVTMKGIDIVVDSDQAWNGGGDNYNMNIGANIECTDATLNYGIVITNENGAPNADIVMKSSANAADYAVLATNADGALTIQTVDGDAADADLTFTVDGDISLAANGGSNSFQLQSSNFAVTTGGDVEILRSVGVGVPVSASLGMNVHHNPTSLKISTGGGEVVAFGIEDGSDFLAAGAVVYLDVDGGWKYTDADAVASSAGLLGIALGTAVSDGILLRGYFHFATASVHQEHVTGSAVYLSTEAADIDFVAPSAPGDVVRVIGYGTSVANLIYFNPDNTWIEL